MHHFLFDYIAAVPNKCCLILQDTIQTFYDITRREVETLELKTSAKDREMELMEDNHRYDRWFC